MSFSIDCLTPHPPSPSKRLIHSRRFALSERGSRLPHAPAPRSRRQPHVGRPAQGTSSHRRPSYPQVVSTGLCMAVGVCGMSPFFLCATPVRDLHTGRAPLPRLPAQAATHLGTASPDTEFWLKIREYHPISRTRTPENPEADPRRPRQHILHRHAT